MRRRTISRPKLPIRCTQGISRRREGGADAAHAAIGTPGGGLTELRPGDLAAPVVRRSLAGSIFEPVA